MARNWIQFQKGYSLTQFVEEYGSEEQCMDALFRWRWPNGFVCPRCEHSRTSGEYLVGDLICPCLPKTQRV